MDNLLSQEEKAQVEKHIQACDRCKEIVEVTRKMKEEK